MPTAKNKPVSKARPAPPPPKTARRRAPSAAVAPPQPRWSEQYELAVKDYASAVEKVQSRDWAGARPLLNALVKKYSTEPDLLDVADRARAYLKVCERRLGENDTAGQDPFLLGVYHSNRGEFDEALKQFERAASEGGSDRTHYALAAIRAQRGDHKGAIASLHQAIRADDRNRLYALNDPDFDSIRDEPEFIDLVEPEGDGGE
jgi:tetratricopeptide (TPR) repeat protein